MNDFEAQTMLVISARFIAGLLAGQVAPVARVHQEFGLAGYDDLPG
jgi:hypothetical protein